MRKKRALFICVHNSARSQMAQEFLKLLGGDEFEVESAGLEPGALNPLAVDAMKDIGIDISANKTQGVFDLYKSGRKYDYVITVCDESNAGKCPIFIGITEKLHWPFEDPSSFTGSYEEKLEKTKKVRDAIRDKIDAWLKELSEA